MEVNYRKVPKQKCLLKFNNRLKETVMEVNYRNISRTQHHSVIRSPTYETVAFPYKENMGFISSESVTQEDNDRFEPAHGQLNSKSRRDHKAPSSNQGGDSENKQPVE